MVFTRRKKAKHLKPPRPDTQEPAEGPGGVGRRNGKLLDGFLLLYSCRVRLPQEALRSKISGENVVEVVEEDLSYFKNLVYLDISDNEVTMESLRNLSAL